MNFYKSNQLCVEIISQYLKQYKKKSQNMLPSKNQSFMSTKRIKRSKQVDRWGIQSSVICTGSILKRKIPHIFLKVVAAIFDHVRNSIRVSAA